MQLEKVLTPPMGLRISGKSIDVGETFRAYAEGRIGEALGKYFDGGFNGHVTLEREGSGFRTDCAIHLDTGVVLRAEGRAQDARGSFDQAAGHIEKRLRRYKRRLKDHNHARAEEKVAATSYVIAAPDENDEVPAGDAEPVIIAEEATSLETMTVGRAVMTMDLTDAAVVVFRNAASGAVNVVYRRSDGNIGWVDPAFSTKGEGARQ